MPGTPAGTACDPPPHGAVLRPWTSSSSVAAVTPGAPPARPGGTAASQRTCSRPRPSRTPAPGLSLTFPPPGPLFRLEVPRRPFPARVTRSPLVSMGKLERARTPGHTPPRRRGGQGARRRRTPRSGNTGRPCPQPDPEPRPGGGGSSPAAVSPPHAPSVHLAWVWEGAAAPPQLRQTSGSPSPARGCSGSRRRLPRACPRGRGGGGGAAEPLTSAPGGASQQGPGPRTPASRRPQASSRPRTCFGERPQLSPCAILLRVGLPCPPLSARDRRGRAGRKGRRPGPAPRRPSLGHR